MSSKFWADLSNDYEKILENGFGYDVIVYVGEEPNIKEFHLHSNILCYRSQYFYAAFSNEWAEKKDGKFIFRKPNISPQLFDIILRFIYCGNIELNNLQDIDLLKLLIAVDELNIQPLISHIQEFLIEHKIEQNPVDILETIYQYEAFTELCLEVICGNPKILFNSDKFINLKASLLELLLERIDLNMDETEIWENLLKWCFAQQNIKNNDPNQWNKDDITTIERLLHRFIPLIRFYNIEPADFFYKVYRYKDILPQDLIHDLLEFHFVPNMKPKANVIPRKPKLKLDSIIIESKHIALFSSWIDKKVSSYYNEKKTLYNFNLLYRSNRDRFDAQSFHRNCDNKGATIWVAKIQDSTQLIGGYSPFDWNGNCGWKYAEHSFLFNFTNRNGKDNVGLSMGSLTGLGRHDFSNYWAYNDNDIYPYLGIPTQFKIEDFEVFQVINRLR
ncbi:hypothetical protein RclHR1_01930008 [Rhizophagus clarus]|uniref:BTB domain-containing protein n=1 Tax=Rhizophagus clarus TaxID=94130 RepID=A0A2Z6RHF9_9GLOM|nr:hypothetical protein RclHR1_01930008 [Rhizophagus clarus]GES87065.1 hypothetical protein GLOIN_2v1784187 [Rhizophagus clarus]